MQKNAFTLLSLILFCSFQNVYTQQKYNHIGVVNALATYLPFPEITEEGAKACVGGKVEVEVRFHAFRGNVVSARAISGNKLLWKSSERAAKKAKFAAINVNGNRNFYITGIIIYEFAQPKCVIISPLNQKAKYIPKPILSETPKNVKINYPQTIYVQVYIDIDGYVTTARAMSGHPLLRPACETSARQAKFSRLVNQKFGSYYSGILEYKFKSRQNIKF